MKRLILLLCLLPMFAWAGEATLTWTAPTQNTDGTALTDLAGFKIYMGQTLGGPYPVSIDIADPTATTFTVPNLDPGTYYFVATAYNSADPVLESDFSNEATKMVLPPAPNPPTMLAVTDLTVYNVIKQKDKFVMLAAGTVPVNTPCDSTQVVNGRYAVPSDLVTWFGNVEPVVVVADCS